MNEEERCFRCDRNKEEVRLLDAVYGNELIKICEECSLVENIPVIRKPSSSQLVESEKPFTVRQRLRKMAGLGEERAEAKKISQVTKQLIENINLDNLRKPKDYKQILDEKFSLAKKRNLPINLVDNFNWLIMMERKKRKIDRKQLAEAIGESEIVIKMIENKEMPDDALRIINKIEQYLGLRLRKEEGGDSRAKEIIREKLGLKTPARVLSFDKESIKDITIADLKRIKEEKEKIEQDKNKNEKKKVEDVIWRREEKLEDKENRAEEIKEGNKELIDSEIEFED